MERNAHDEDYADVEDVSDSETSNDEENVEKEVLRSAEKDLIDEYKKVEQHRDASVMTHVMNDIAIGHEGSSSPSVEKQLDFDFEVDMNDDPFVGLTEQDTLYRDMWTEAEVAMWRRPDTNPGAASVPNYAANTKRVRFEEVKSHKSSESGWSDDAEDEANETYPDLFAPQDDPALKRRYAFDADEDFNGQTDAFGDGDSTFDFEDEDEKFAFQLDEESDSDDEEMASSESDDDDDDGDKTDEETREEQIARMLEMKKAAGPSNKSPRTPSARKRPFSRDGSTASVSRQGSIRQGCGPRVGTFTLDPTRATMTTDAAGRRITLMPPTKPPERDKGFWERAKMANSRRGSSNASHPTASSSGGEKPMPARPFTAESTLGSMFNGNLDILRNNHMEQTSAENALAVMHRECSSFSAATTTDASDTDGQHVNMQDFVDIGNSEPDSDELESGLMASPAESELMRNGSHLALTPSTVTSFRNNQHQAKHLSSLASHPAKRASTHEYNALQKGRRGAANMPITPARKKRVSQDLSTPSAAGVRKNVVSPPSTRRTRSRGNSLAKMTAASLDEMTRRGF